MVTWACVHLGVHVHLGSDGQPGGPRLGSALSLPHLCALHEAGSFDWKDIRDIKWIRKEEIMSRSDFKSEETCLLHFGVSPEHLT